MSPPVCWICLDAGKDENTAQPPVRGCACRGSAGHAHVSCISDYARSQSDAAAAAAAANGSRQVTDPTILLDSFRKAWTYCPTCEQKYVGEVALSIAQAMMVYTAPLEDADYRRIVSRLTLASASSSAGKMSQAAELFVRVLDTLSGVNYKVGPLGILFPLLEIEAVMSSFDVLEHLGRSSQTQCRDLITRSIRHISTSAYAHDPIVDMLKAKADLMGTGRERDSHEAALEVSRREYEVALSTRPNALYTLQCQRDLVEVLAKNGQWEEAISLGRELVEKADRVLGKDHQSAKCFRSILEAIESNSRTFGGSNTADGKVMIATIVGLPASEMNGRSCCIKKRSKDGKYIVLIQSASSNGTPQKFKAKAENLVFPKDTPITVEGLASASHLNGRNGGIVSFDADKSRYVVNIDGEPKSMSVKPQNVRVKFD